MSYTHYDLGGLPKGKTVEVVLQGNTANVYLMSNENLMKYTKALPFQAMGGLMTFSPIKMQTTAAAHWHVVIDLPPGAGTVKTSYRVLGAYTSPNISTMLATFKPSETQRRIAAEKAQKLKEQSEAQSAPSPESSEPSQITCKACGVLSMPGKFCTECGLPFQKTCRNCNTVNALNVKFCGECGFKLG